MTETAEKIKPEVLRLAPADRAELAHLLILSLDDDTEEEIEAAWDEELGRRLQRITSGESPGRPADDVLAGIRAKYAR